MVQFTPAAVVRHLQGMIAGLRSRVNGKVREALQQTVARSAVWIGGSLRIEGQSRMVNSVSTEILAGRGDQGDLTHLEPSARSGCRQRKRTGAR